jgi:hypothetical protein
LDYFFGISILIISCIEDETLKFPKEATNKIDAESVSYKEAIGYFEKFQKKNNLKKSTTDFTVTPDWNTLRKELIYYTDTLLTKSNVTVNREGDYSSELMFIKVNGQMKSGIYTIYKDSIGSNGEIISAQIFFNELDGDFIDGYVIQNGEFTKRYQMIPESIANKINKNKKSQLSLKEAPAYCDDCWTIQGSTVWLGTIKNSESSTTPYDPTSTAINFNTYYTNNSSLSGGGISHSVNTLFTDPPKVNLIINKLTNPCGSNIFTELQNEMLKKDLINKVENTPEGSPLNFVESILKLFNDSKGTNLLIRNSDNIGNKNAQTTGTSIVLKTSYLKTATQLSIARTMIHEILHTYLNGIYLDLPDFGNKTLLEKMKKFATDNGYDPINDPNRFQHEFMGQFVDAMGYSLYDWDKKYGTGGNLGWDYYKSMAFAGFIYAKKDSNGNYILDNNGNKIYEDTDSFKVLVPNQTDRDNIKKIISDETEGNSNAKGDKCQ